MRGITTWGITLFTLAVAGNALAAPPRGSDERSANASGEGSAESKARRKRAFTRLREILRAEPSAREVQLATLAFYKLEPERLNRMATAARVKGLVPEIEGGIDNTIGHLFTNTKDGLIPILPNPPENPNPNNYKERTESANDQFLWRMRAVWNLDRLVFNSEELDVKSLASIEETLVREVITVYFSRRRLLAKLVLTPPEDDEERFYEFMRLDEMTATIDALTGGNFASHAWQHESDPTP